VVLGSLLAGAAQAGSVAFSGYFPASVYWGNSGYLPILSPKGTSIYYIDKDKKNGDYNYLNSQTTSITFYSGSNQTQAIDKATQPTSGPPVITSFDLTLKNITGTSGLAAAATTYKISFNWNFDPFNSKCNGGMATADASKNSDCRWDWEVVDKLPGDAKLTADKTILTYGAYTTPAPIYLAAGSSVTFRSDIKYSNGTVPKKVPAPLPALGAGAAFAFSRRLRRRIGSADGPKTTASRSPTPASAPIQAAVTARQHRRRDVSRYGELLGGPRPM